MGSSSVVAVTGATGFVGRRLLEFLAARPDATVRVLTRERGNIERTSPPTEVVQGDMRDPAAFGRLLEPGCTWVNVARLEPMSEDGQTAVMRSLVAVCRAKGIKRIVHCSSAVVVGRNTAEVITEATPCEPADGYETAKLAVEELLLRESSGRLEVAILRPTAVFGPGGSNLLKLAGDLECRPAFFNYVKSCIQGSRRMNLVHRDNVVAALLFLLDAEGIAAETFIISDDESPINNYRDVERRLMDGLGIPAYAAAPVAMPQWMLSTALRMAARTNVNPSRIYDCAKIVGRGLAKPVAFERGLFDFISWYRTRKVPAVGP